MNNQVVAKLKLPDSPGLYFFKKGKQILYIGKATSLRDRVRSYFRGDLAEARGPLIVEMLRQARGVDFRKTDSVLEALLLEAELIKKHQPFYNTDEKDDKSWNMVVITSEDFPRVLLVRKKELENPPSHQNATPLSGKEELILPLFPPKADPPLAEKGVPPHCGARGRDFTGRLPFKYIFGPFPQGGALKEGMKIIRKIFPYRDAKCFPPKNSNTNSNTNKNAIGVYSDVLKNIRIYRPCFNRQIGLCPGTCTGEISKQDYAKTIRNIKLLFQGKKPRLLQALRREMNEYAKRREFEKAAAVKKTIFALEHIQDVSLIKSISGYSMSTDSVPVSHNRVEAYDIAHLGGGALVGVMTVVEDGETAKSEYRKFKIRGGTGINDTAALREILSRRLAHREWPLPGLIVVDGSDPQKRGAEGVLRARGLGIPVVAVVKDERHRPARIIGDLSLTQTHEKSILLANAEAHRFALSYHRRFRSRKFLEKF